ncbi:hypothetical protein [Actinomycetospora straminea]|uniref:DUF4190 domain-containing protein n=1 Tax=Actinomycetospora straminea TaxID=663607 RepID=A0ABP9DVI5_9PSEU|nr:hypothetical protein [Actinomycetospora straminea]MDD7935243.1 hypothetical protein [Actinomycetospora straminea]
MSPDPAASPATDAGASEEPGRRRPGIAVAAPVLGAMALVSAWTGWGGLALGLLAVVVALAALARLRGRPGRRGPVAGLALGVVAVAVAVAVEGSTLAGAVTYLETGGVRTLDECMRQAQNEKEQHVCKSQHLEEYRARYPDRLDP